MARKGAGTVKSPTLSGAATKNSSTPMLVDNPIQPQQFPPYQTSLEEFINFDLFPSSSNPTAGSSGSSPHSSPSNSFTGLPPTPPDFFSRQDDPFSPSPFFSIAAVLEEEQAKFAAVPPSATTAQAMISSARTPSPLR